MADSKSTHEVVLTAVDKASAIVDKLEGRFKKFGSTVDKIFGGLGIAGVASLGVAFEKGVEKAAEEEQVMKRLATAVNLAGVNYRAVSGDVEELLKSQERLTKFSDDQSADSLARLIQLTNNYGLSMKALPLVEDLASTGLMDLESASTAVGKALTGHVMLLQKMGFHLKAGDDVLAKLSGRLGGSAAKNVDTFSGRLQQLRNQIENAFEALGGPLLEPLKGVIEKLRDSIGNPELIRKITEFSQSIADKLPAAVTALVSLGTFVANHGSAILKFFEALVLIRVASWALSAGQAIASLVSFIATLPAWVISGGVVSAAGAAVVGGAYYLNEKQMYGYNNPSVPTDANTPRLDIGDVNKTTQVYNIYTKKWETLASLLDLAAVNTKNAGNKVVQSFENIARELTAREKKVLGSLYYGTNTTLSQDWMNEHGYSRGDRRTLGRRFPGSEQTRDTPRSPYGDVNADRAFSQSYYKSSAQLSELQDRIATIAPYFQQAMSAVMSTLVQGFLTGKGQIVDVLKSLRDSIFNILAQIAARLAVQGLVSLIPGVGSFAAAGSLLKSIGFSIQRPAPVGANPSVGVSGFHSGYNVTLIVQGDLVNSEEKVRRFIDAGVTQAQRGGNKLSRYLATTA
jgi:hypothetical protein